MLFDELAWRGLIADMSDSELSSKLKPGDKFYVGFDPSAASLQIGNLVPIIAAIHLAKAKLSPILLFGGATGAIGDPSGKRSERQLLTREVIDQNVKLHQNKMNEMLDRVGIKARFVNNYDWTHNLSVLQFLTEIGKHLTVNYMLAKDSVKVRLDGDGISFTEFSYMLLQAFDFYHLYKSMGCKLQVGGSDQWGNITAGLELIRRKLQGDAYGLSFPLITDSEGKKFGKSESGTLWLDSKATSPFKLHQFFLNSPDSDVIKLLKIYSFLNKERITELEQSLLNAPEKREAQTALADAVLDLVHGADETKLAKRSAEVLFGGSMQGLNDTQLESIFSDVPSSQIERTRLKEMTIVDLFTECALTKSKGDAKRLIGNGGAYLNNERISDSTLTVSSSGMLEKDLFVLRSGKKSYHLIKPI